MTSIVSHSTSMPNNEVAFWRVLQVLGLVATVALLAGLVVEPDVTLTILWNLVIPLLPATFILSPAVWRNVCPLATLNMTANGRFGRRKLTGKLISASATVGLVLLAILVPARRFLFNTNGIALAAIIVLVAVAALALGMVFDMKAGFCNSICPVLPVERLYGQRPLLRIKNPRCVPCTTCTVPGCIDLAPNKSIAQTLGRARKSHAWLMAPFGVFVSAFPGFVVGYYMTQDVPLAAAGLVYWQIFLWAAGSLVVTNVVVRLLDVSSDLAVLTLAACAVGLYYWFVAPVAASAWRLPMPVSGVVRVAAVALVTLWFWRGWREVVDA